MDRMILKYRKALQGRDSSLRSVNMKALFSKGYNGFFNLNLFEGETGMKQSKPKRRHEQCLKAGKKDRVYVGLDVHKRSIHIAIRINGKQVRTAVLPSQAKAVLAFMEEVREGIRLIVYEAGPTGFGLARSLGKAGLPVSVIAPGKTPRPANHGNKSDRLDCLHLAEFAEKNMLRPIVIPTVQEEGDRHINRLRDQLMKKKKRVKQQIKSLLLQFGIKEPVGLDSWTTASLSVLKNMKLRASIKMSLTILLEELGFLERRVKEVEKCLRELSGARRHKEAYMRLKTHPGVGEKTAMKYIAEVYQPERFDKPTQVASYLGLAPKVRQSGETRKEGGIQKSGREALRAMLIEASWRWMGLDERGKHLYTKLLRNTGNGKKAIVGVARHMAINLWLMLTRQRDYQPG